MRFRYSFSQLSLLIILILLNSITLAQSKTSTICIRLLQKNIIDKRYVFDNSKKRTHDETQLTYLGTLKTNTGKQFKIIRYCWIWGISKRATNRILVYNQQNKYLGNYYLTTTDDLPLKIEHNRLIFKILDDNTSKTVITKISFDSGIPKSIYIRGDDLYSFDTGKI
jgi:hypothetical protein